jgi:hypothetical protein
MKPNRHHGELLAYAAMIKRLDDWAQVNRQRDRLIKEAREFGVSKSEIAAHMDINRGTVIRVLGTDDNEEAAQ